MSGGAAELRPPEPAEQGGEESGRGFLADLWATLASDEFAVRVLVAVVVVLAVGWLGVKEAAAAVVLSQVLTEAIKNFVRRQRLSKRRTWLATVLLLLLGSAQKARAAVRRRLGRKPKPAIPPPADHSGLGLGAALSIAVSLATVALITAPELALGHSLVGDRRTTFFGGERGHGGNNQVVRGPGPTITLPKRVEVAATGPRGARVSYAASVDEGTLLCAPRSGAIFALGTTEVRCRASSQEGTTAGMFPVQVVDRDPPRLQLPAAIRREFLGERAAVDYTASARDLVDGRVPVRCAPRSGSSFSLGSTSVRCTAADKHGNRAQGSFPVLLAHPAPGTPLLTLPSELTVEASGPAGARVDFTASARAPSGAPLPISCSPASGSTLAIGTHSVGCQAALPGRAEKRASFSVTVRDTTAPTLLLPRTPRLEAETKQGVPASFTVSATDLVDGTVEASCQPAPGTQLAIGTHTVACTAADGRDNEAKGSFALVVYDAPPLLTVPADIVIPYITVKKTPVRYGASASDRVDGVLRPSCLPRSGSGFPLGPTTVTCSVTDSAKNEATKSFTITVVDRVKPVLSLPESFTAWAPFDANRYRVPFEASARDAVDGPLAVSCRPRSGSLFRVGRRTTVYCRASDRAGNSASGSFTVTVEAGVE